VLSGLVRYSIHAHTAHRQVPTQYYSPPPGGCDDVDGGECIAADEPKVVPAAEGDQKRPQQPYMLRHGSSNRMAFVVSLQRGGFEGRGRGPGRERQGFGTGHAIRLSAHSFFGFKPDGGHVCLTVSFTWAGVNVFGHTPTGLQVALLVDVFYRRSPSPSHLSQEADEGSELRECSA
jgi:hypothetical protein